MTDLKNGIIEIEGMLLSRHTKVSDFNDLSNPNIDVKISKRGHTYVKFLKPIISNGIEMQVEVAFYVDSIIPEIQLFPRVPTELAGKYGAISQYKLNASKQWLRGMIDKKPTTDCDEGISYHFDNFHVSAFVRKDIHYGLVGGEINLYFDNEV